MYPFLSTHIVKLILFIVLVFIGTRSLHDQLGGGGGVCISNLFCFSRKGRLFVLCHLDRSCSSGLAILLLRRISHFCCLGSSTLADWGCRHCLLPSHNLLFSIICLLCAICLNSYFFDVSGHLPILLLNKFDLLLVHLSACLELAV